MHLPGILALKYCPCSVVPLRYKNYFIPNRIYFKISIKTLWGHSSSVVRKASKQGKSTIRLWLFWVDKFGGWKKWGSELTDCWTTYQINDISLTDSVKAGKVENFQLHQLYGWKRLLFFKLIIENIYLNNYLKSLYSANLRDERDF